MPASETHTHSMNYSSPHFNIIHSSFDQCEIHTHQKRRISISFC